MFPLSPRKVAAFTLSLLCFSSFIPLHAQDDSSAPSKEKEWYSFSPKGGDAPSVFGMEDWLEKPAGKNGPVIAKADKLFSGPKELKLWGVNVSYAAMAKPKDVSTKSAAFFARHGINLVRMHKFMGTGWAGIRAKDTALDFDKEKIDLMDFYISELKKRGIYYTFSPIFKLSVGIKDRKRIKAFDEVFQVEGENVKGEAYGIYYVSDDMQAIIIEQMQKILAHKNTYTGQSYAQDPALAGLEMVNEDDMFFYSTMGAIKKSPTYTKIASEKFCAWLQKKYGSEAALKKAWGDGGIGSWAQNESAADESFGAKTLYPVGNPWFFDPAQLDGSQANRKQRLLDTMAFFHDLQNEFYSKYAAAARKAGYKGPLITSNWVAGSGPANYFNLASDAESGDLIDRHNYFGGSGAGGNNSMLAAAGSGLISSGMLQVSNRPFYLSEWANCYPNDWNAEGPAIIAAYGLGLQGWDMSAYFSNDLATTYSAKLGPTEWDPYKPTVICTFPAITRALYRGDVKESPVQAALKVHVPSLQEGKLGFLDKSEQRGDIKVYGSDKIPAATLTAARVSVDFTKQFEETPAFDIEKYKKDGAIVSATGQLAWVDGQNAQDGYFTINTPGTKGVVGFAPKKSFALDEVTIEPDNKFAVIYVTSLEKDKDIKGSRKILITAIARARDSGGIQMEPVTATFTIAHSGTPTVTILDHDGRPTARKLEVKDGKFTIDGSVDKTLYYLVSY